VTGRRLALGTVELGLPYGFRESGGESMPDSGEAIELIRAAVDAGVTMVDTAPGYGVSEERVGAALATTAGSAVTIATKIENRREGDPEGRRSRLLASIERSRRRLRRDRIDLLQIHNATANDLDDPLLMGLLEDAVASGRVAKLGASVYDLAVAERLASDARFSSIQVAFNLLDQRLLAAAWPGRVETLLLRSLLLRGALTRRSHSLPESQRALAAAVEQARRWAAEWSPGDLARAALRFAASASSSGWLLLGLSTRAELDQALAVLEEPPLSDRACAAARLLACSDPQVIDPRCWEEVQSGQ
jgi:aryl-alcohol dehydrogenase-like predicted oxidoreductase